MFGKRSQSFEITIFERATGDAVAKEDPTQDETTRVERHDRFGAKGIESATHDSSLPLVVSARGICARDEVRVQFEPAHERVALIKFQLLGFRQTVNSRAQAIRRFLVRAREKTNAADSGCIRERLHQTGDQRIDVVHSSKHARKAQKRKGLTNFGRFFS